MKGLLFGFTASTAVVASIALICGGLWLIGEIGNWVLANMHLPDWAWMTLIIWVVMGVIFSAMSVTDGWS